MADIDYETRRQLEGTTEQQIRKVGPIGLLRLQLIAVERQLVEHDASIDARRKQLDVDRKALGNWIRGRGILKAKAHLIGESIAKLEGGQ